MEFRPTGTVYILPDLKMHVPDTVSKPNGEGWMGICCKGVNDNTLPEVVEDKGVC